MRKLVESLRRLYIEKQLLNIDTITELYNNNKITEEEYKYIIEGGINNGN